MTAIKRHYNHYNFLYRGTTLDKYLTWKWRADMSYDELFHNICFLKVHLFRPSLVTHGLSGIEVDLVKLKEILT